MTTPGYRVTPNLELPLWATAKMPMRQRGIDGVMMVRMSMVMATPHPYHSCHTVKKMQTPTLVRTSTPCS